jgi:putative two-component system response regulator
MAVADVYDALISKRVYKPPMPHEEAVKIIKEGKESHFDPEVVDAFLELESTFRNIAFTFADFEEERQLLLGADGLKPADVKPIERVLVVEDNEINLEIMLSQLSSLGLKVSTAAGGKEALARYQEDNYDLILTDLEMPEMNGYELTAEVRRLEAGTGKPTTILAITASDLDLSEERAKELGFDGLMLKPLDPELLQKKWADIARKGPERSNTPDGSVS